MDRKKLRVNPIEIGELMHHAVRSGRRFYLDLETGKTVGLHRELFKAFERGDTNDLPEWTQESVLLARAILSRDPRYVEIPEFDSRAEWDALREFVKGLSDAAARERFERAMHGRNAFRGFHDELKRHPELAQRWIEFEASRRRDKARAWLEGLGVTAPSDDAAKPQ
jgi:hypothetical protein